MDILQNIIKTPRKKKRFAFLALDLMALPAVLYLFINNYIPMAGLFIAFKKINYAKGIFGSDWCGFKNFEYLFKTKDAFIITRNTVLYNLTFIIVGITAGVAVGILLSELWSKRARKVYQTTILLPQLISWVIVAYIGYAFLSSATGFINNSLLSSQNAVNFYGEAKYWPYILVFANVWKGLGYNSIIFLSAIVGIDRALYEAAYVDGAGRWKQITCITIPMLKPVITMLALLSIGRIFYSDFGLFYQLPMNSGALFSVTNTIDTYVYRALLQQNNIAMSSAAGAYQSCVGFILIMLSNALVRKLDRDNALF